LALSRGRLSLALGAGLIALVVLVSQSGAALARQEQRQPLTGLAGGLLAPQPWQASLESSRPRTDGCEISMTASGPQPECRYLPDQGHGDVLLWGDSHAVQWFPAVFELARSRGWGLRVWTHASCPVAQVTKSIGGNPSDGCDIWRRASLHRILTEKPSLVITANYASRAPALFDPLTGHQVKGAAAEKLYLSGYLKTLGALGSAGIPTLLIRDQPAFVVSGPKCALEFRRDLSRCVMKRKKALGPGLDAQAALQVKGIAIMDLTDVYCDRRVCHQVIGNYLVYKDNNHFTDEMVMHLKGRLGQALDAISGR
jgi:hypothetical protein